MSDTVDIREIAEGLKPCIEVFLGSDQFRVELYKYNNRDMTLYLTPIQVKTMIEFILQNGTTRVGETDLIIPGSSLV